MVATGLLALPDTYSRDSKFVYWTVFLILERTPDAALNTFETTSSIVSIHV